MTEPAAQGAPTSLAAFVRRHDPDRYLTALFAPADRRETLFALYAFNHELAHAWEVASQPATALIRLQWWHEVVEGAPRRHEVATPLTKELAAGRLASEDLLALIEGREREATGLDGPAEWEAYLAETAGRVALAAGRTLGATGASLDRLAALGTGYGVAGLLRSGGLRRSWGHLAPADPAALAAFGRARVGVPAPLPRAVVAAGLVGVLARRDLRGHPQPGLRGLGDRVAVTVAALRSQA